MIFASRISAVSVQNTRRGPLPCRTLCQRSIGGVYVFYGESRRWTTRPTLLLMAGVTAQVAAAQTPGRKKVTRTRPAGFEPATYGLEIRCSIQLSYERKVPKQSILLQFACKSLFGDYNLDYNQHSLYNSWQSHCRFGCSERYASW